VIIYIFFGTVTITNIDIFWINNVVGVFGGFGLFQWPSRLQSVFSGPPRTTSSRYRTWDAGWCRRHGRGRGPCTGFGDGFLHGLVSGLDVSADFAHFFTSNFDSSCFDDLKLLIFGLWHLTKKILSVWNMSFNNCIHWSLALLLKRILFTTGMCHLRVGSTGLSIDLKKEFCLPQGCVIWGLDLKKEFCLPQGCVIWGLDLKKEFCLPQGCVIWGLDPLVSSIDLKKEFCLPQGCVIWGLDPLVSSIDLN